ncbi:MAG: T9SS type A sorting domain-containing protein [Candidatus Cloacimonetes bacterium]|jgi:predicted outer membrane repeat protein|nr:T9SS type A sorting domain-containing protein [Candidatus Cloacimonadota bacterium]
MKLKTKSFHRRCRFAPQNRHLLFLFVLICVNSLLNSTTWHIKQDGTGNFITIQEGINASADSDTVLVYPGTYFENLDMNGKNITLASLELITGEEAYIDSTIIDGQHLESCIRIHNGETDAYIQGFTIQNGFGTHFWANDGGGLLVHDYSTAYLINCFFKDNLASQGGAIYARHGSLYLSGIKIKENSADFGGAIFLADDSTVNFNSDNRCNIYNNNAGKGADVFVMDTGQVDVIVDTFSVYNPSRYFAEYLEGSTYTFDIQNNWMDLEPNDLYVAVDGDDNNSGLTLEEPFKNISWAVRKIQADEQNPRTVHVAAGTYSYASNQQIYPIGCKEYVSIIGEDMENTILINDFIDRLFNSFNNYGEIIIKNFSLKNNFSHYSDCLTSIMKSNSVKISNIIMDDNTNMKFIFMYYQVGADYDNITISNNSTNSDSGIILETVTGIIKNCKIFNNSTPSQVQSALYLFTDEDLLIENCIFTNNISTHSDGNTIRTASHYNTEPDIIFKNCLITGNQSNSDSVIDMFGDGDNQFINCTIVDNISDMNTIKAYGDITLKNTIMHNNTDNEVYMVDETPYGFTYELNVDNCNIKNGEDGIYNQNNANIINWGEGNIEEDPLFLLLGDDPYQLTELSPCIDTGTPDTTGLFLPPWDLLHNHRVWDGDDDGIAIIDMGCYEFGADPVGIINNELPITNYELRNYPNPFNPETKIVFDLPESGQVKLEIYNIKGQKVKTLLDCYMSPGRSEMIWNSQDDHGKRVSSGVYFYRLQTPTKILTKKMLLLK